MDGPVRIWTFASSPLIPAQELRLLAFLSRTVAQFLRVRRMLCAALWYFFSTVRPPHSIPHACLRFCIFWRAASGLFQSSLRRPDYLRGIRAPIDRNAKRTPMDSSRQTRRNRDRSLRSPNRRADADPVRGLAGDSGQPRSTVSDLVLSDGGEFRPCGNHLATFATTRTSPGDCAISS